MMERKEHACSIEGCNNPHYGKGWCNAHIFMPRNIYAANVRAGG